jgi:hypothetical protein
MQTEESAYSQENQNLQPVDGEERREPDDKPSVNELEVLRSCRVSSDFGQLLLLEA